MSTVADTIAPLVTAMLGDTPPVRIELWDNSALGPDPAHAVGTLRVTSPDALRRILWSPNEIGVGRAFVVGDIEVDGPIIELVESLRDATGGQLTVPAAAVAKVAVNARALGMIGRPLPPPPQEAPLPDWRHGLRQGVRHSLRRDATAISHHYDTGNDFYRIVLGPSMTYSCARFVDDGASLEDAQQAKHDLIARKLGLHERPGMRLLDVGCGWGSMAIHAASAYGAKVVGVTISEEQAALARTRVAEAGVSELVDIRLQDYRQLDGETFDAISSVGMSEHVGAKQLDRYFSILRAALGPTGRLLNHAISSVGGSKMNRKSFVGRYVFPDGELIDVGDTVLAMEAAGFEVRDTECLREHYARTLREWLRNLESNWDAAVAAADVGKARIWRLYMAGSAVGFTDGGVSIHQVLGVVARSDGTSAMPATRCDWN